MGSIKTPKAKKRKMKKKFKKVPLINLGGNFKLGDNSQIIIQRMKQDELLVQNMDSDFNITLSPSENKITIEINNFNLGDALVLFDDKGIAEKKVVHGRDGN